MLRSALTFVSAAALLLAGFTFAGRVIGLWDPVEPGDSGALPVRVLDRPDFDAASRARAPCRCAVEAEPASLSAIGPSDRSRLPRPQCPAHPRAVAQAARGPGVVAPPTGFPRTGHANVLFASQLGGNLGLSRAPPAQQTLKELPSPPLRSRGPAAARIKNLAQLAAAVRTAHPRARRAFAEARVAMPISVVRPGRSRVLRTFAATTRVRVCAVHSFLYAFRDDIVLAVVLGVTIGLLAALYAS